MTNFARLRDPDGAERRAEAGEAANALQEPLVRSSSPEAPKTTSSDDDAAGHSGHGERRKAMPTTLAKTAPHRNRCVCARTKAATTPTTTTTATTTARSKTRSRFGAAAATKFCGGDDAVTRWKSCGKQSCASARTARSTPAGGVRSAAVPRENLRNRAGRSSAN